MPSEAISTASSEKLITLPKTSSSLYCLLNCSSIKK